MLRQSFFRFFVIAAVLAAIVATAFAQSNIDSTVPNKHAWGENIGWTNWRGEATPGQGVHVGAKVLSGFIWGENVGWMNVGDGTPSGIDGRYANANGTDFGVNVGADGSLSGYAWGENIGWINFGGGAMATPAQPARILCASPPGEPLARLTGYAWGENIGWINLTSTDPTKYVSLDAASTPISCDMNMDGLLNGRDVQPFVDALLGGATWNAVCSGDVEPPPDGMLDLDDVDPFVNCLLTAP